MSFPRNAATPKAIDVGSVILIADGTVQTSGCSVRVQLDSGSWGAGGGTLAYDATSGAITYAPLQAETNGDVLNIAVYKAACIGCSTTVLMDPASLPAAAAGAKGGLPILDAATGLILTGFGGDPVSAIPAAASVRSAIGMAAADLDDQLAALVSGTPINITFSDEVVTIT